MKNTILTLTPLLLFYGCGTNNDSLNDINTITVPAPKSIPIGSEEKFPDNAKKLKHSRSFTADEQDQIRSDGLTYLNQLRQNAGMLTYSSQSNLNTSAYNHAHYLVLNNVIGHGEDSADDGFTGASPSDRAVYAGYLHRQVSENLSTGNNSVNESIDGLFSAIYHRFGFLSFTSNEIGIGADSSASYADGCAYNYNMGISQLSTLCAGESYTGSGSYYTGVCADENFKIEYNTYNDVMTENIDANPDYVIWPYNNQNDTIPVFYEEYPDPLPECSVSGYPISIQFNPNKTGDIDIQNIKLYYENNGTEITNTKFLDNDTDPNDRFSTKEAALFPLERLMWDTNYQAKVNYIEDGVAKNITWNFKTKSLPYPYYVINNADSSMNIKSGQTYLFYLPPSDCNDDGGKYKMSYSSELSIENSFYDQNTIQLTVTGDSGTVTVLPSNGRNFTLTIAESDTATYPKDKQQHKNKHDFNGDNISDIMWRHADTGKYVFYMLDNNGQRASYTEGVVVDNNWSVGGIGDFDGDGINDIMWRNESTGQYRIHLLNSGGSLKADKLGLSVSASWSIGGTKDYNGDGIDDIMWRNRTTGKYVFYFMNTNGERGSYKEGLSVSGSWYVGGTGDFNNDGIDDIIWRHADTGKYVFYMLDKDGQRSAYFEGLVVSNEWIIGGIGDFDGDGIDDIMWRNESSGLYHIYLLNNNGSLKADKPGLNVSYSWIVGGINDYNGDGIDDIMWRNRSTGKYVFYFMNSNGERDSYQEGLNVSYSWEVF